MVNTRKIPPARFWQTALGEFLFPFFCIFLLFYSLFPSSFAFRFPLFRFFHLSLDKSPNSDYIVKSPNSDTISREALFLLWNPPTT